MRISCIQADIKNAAPGDNFIHIKDMITRAAEEKPDVIVLPEAWNTGFIPKPGLEKLCDDDGMRVKDEIGKLARFYSVNIVAGSVMNVRDAKIYNTSYVFDRQGSCIAQYDKTHLFSPAHENEYCEKGNHICKFSLDGVSCGVIICYDLRFPELVRSMSVSGLEVLFIVSQWNADRLDHLLTLSKARAIENQMFTVCCNACSDVSGGCSSVYAPDGKCIALASEKEEIIYADCDIECIGNIREKINVFADRRKDLYSL